MVASKDSIIKDVKKYIGMLRKHGFPIQKALLFGSWSRGCAGEESDVDVAFNLRRIYRGPISRQTKNCADAFYPTDF